MNPPVGRDVRAMREEFDRSFAEPTAEGGTPGERLLLVRVAGHAYALRMIEISGVVADRRVVAIPSPVPDLLGLAGIRGGLIAVYGLAALLGHDRALDRGRWIAMCEAGEPVGLSFGELEGQLSVPAHRIIAAAPPGQGHGMPQHVEHLVQTEDGVRPIVAVPILLEAIRRRCARARAVKER